MVENTNMSVQENRKDQHLHLCLQDKAVESKGTAQKATTGLEDFTFEYDSLPELDFDEIRIHTEFLGKQLKAPLMIGAMTGGTDKAQKYNYMMARAAEEMGIAFSLGSQRPMVSNDNFDSFDVKKVAPNLPLLLGNIGAVQLNYGLTVSQIQELIEKVQCDGFTFHLNPLQEAIQPEGDRNFKGLIEKLGQVIPQLSVPVSIKEVGAGISRNAALKLRQLPLSAVEVAGVGGTSWAYIESQRNEDPVARSTGEELKSFGIPTARSIQICREIFPDKYIIGSGGIRTGLDVAKALALGADVVAFALPMLRAVELSYEQILVELKKKIHQLKTVMFVTGSANILDLRTKIRDRNSV